MLEGLRSSGGSKPFAQIINDGIFYSDQNYTNANYVRDLPNYVTLSSGIISIFV